MDVRSSSSKTMGSKEKRKGWSKEEEAARYKRIIDECGGTLRRRDDATGEAQPHIW